MSEAAPRRRIRAEASAVDPDVMAFVLDAPVQPGRSGQFEAGSDAPLPRAIFAVQGIQQVEFGGPTIWVRKAPEADWPVLKPAIAGAIRRVLDESDAPLGEKAASGAGDPDADLRQAVEALLERQVNPSVATHGGHIAVERVEGGTVHLRMSGGCQGCAASSATLRQGVERMLRAALPQIDEIVDVTDHAAGHKPYYTQDGGATPMLNLPIPAGVITREDGQITVDPEYLAPRLGLTPETLRAGLRSGAVLGVTQTGRDADVGKSRVIIRSGSRAWAAEIGADGAAREIPPPHVIQTAAGKERDLPNRVRTHLKTLSPELIPISYGTLARALGLWMPGAVGRVTAALEATMREDASGGRPFIAARAVGRACNGLPGKGFFDLARALGRGPQEGESEPEFHARELRHIDKMIGNEVTEHERSLKQQA